MIRKVDTTNVYEQLVLTGGGGRGTMATAAMAAGFSPVFPDDPEWSEVFEQHLDQLSEFAIEGLEAISIFLDGECVGLYGYRMVSEPKIVVHRYEVELPYELFQVVGDGEEVSTPMVHAAQLFIASHEDLRIVMAAH